MKPKGRYRSVHLKPKRRIEILEKLTSNGRMLARFDIFGGSVLGWTHWSVNWGGMGTSGSKVGWCAIQPKTGKIIDWAYKDIRTGKPNDKQIAAVDRWLRKESVKFDLVSDGFGG